MSDATDIVWRLSSTRWHGSPFSKDAADAAREIERLRQTIRDTIQSLERNSTSAPVVECLKAVIYSGIREGKS